MITADNAHAGHSVHGFYLQNNDPEPDVHRTGMLVGFPGINWAEAYKQQE